MVTEFTSHLIPLKGFSSSMQGGRSENQDDWGFVDTPLGFLLVVCDGMGGGPGGKTASYIAKNVLMSALLECNPQTSRVDALKMAVSKANDALYQKMDEMPQLQGMGSTLVAVLINKQSAIIAHLGDSRCYRVSRGRVVHRTDDHSLVGELVRNKALTEEQARTSPQSNVIMRGLGNTSNHVAEISEVPYCKNDRFILCTDGIWGVMPHGQLVQRLTSEQTISALVSNLSVEVDQIGNNTGGHHDNHTLAVIEMKTESIMKDKMSKLFRIIFGTLTVILAFSVIINIVCLAKLESTPKMAELEEMERKNQELQSEMALYQNVKDGDTKEWITKVEILQYEKELLEESQKLLIAKVDSLETVITKNQQANASVKQTTTNAQKSSVATAQELAQRALNLFKKMEDAKGGSVSEAVKKKAEFRSKIVAQLLMLDKKTSGKYAQTIAGINRELQHINPVTDMVDVNPENNKEYISTGGARKKIRELTKKVQEIKEKIK